MVQHPEFRHCDDIEASTSLNQPPTLAGAANNETELLPPVEVPTLEAWSQDETVEIVRRSWGEVSGTAVVMLVCAVVAAFAIAVVGWVLAAHQDVPALPQSTPTLMPAPTVPYTPPPTPTSERPVKTMVPGPSAPTVSPKVESAPDPAVADERFLSLLTSAGLRITDVPLVIQGAHEMCSYLGSGHSVEDAVRVAMSNNGSLSRTDAHSMVVSAVRVYCPEQAG